MTPGEAGARIRAAGHDLPHTLWLIFTWRLLCQLATLVDEDQLDEAIEEALQP